MFFVSPWDTVVFCFVCTALVPRRESSYFSGELEFVCVFLVLKCGKGKRERDKDKDKTNTKTRQFFETRQD